MIAVFIAGSVAMVIALVGTRYLITLFAWLGKGQPILGHDDLGPVHHIGKQGTPTMGGVAIIVAGFVGWFVAHVRRGLPFSDQAIIIWTTILLLALMGFLDDFLKVRKGHNRGIFWKKKGVVTFAMTVALTTWMLLSTGVSQTLSLTRYNLPGWHLPSVLWVLWTALMVWATTNAVNVTDGLDGLAAGSALFGFIAFTFIAYWAFRNPGYSVVNPLDLAALSAAMAGGCAGFLWWNAAPARIFMGDVGALGIGAALGMLAVATNTHLLLPLICALNVLEAGSVAVQMSVFKISGRRKRLFKMSPIHHHFELVGWPETTVIIRFWIIAGVCVAAAVAVFLADFTRHPFLGGLRG